MKTRAYTTTSLLAICLCLTPRVWADAPDPQSLRLIPFPKELSRGKGALALTPPLLLATNDTGPGPQQLRREIARAVPTGAVTHTSAVDGTTGHTLLLHHADATPTVPVLLLPTKGWGDGYVLQVTPTQLFVRSATPRGLFYGIQTARQLIRANLQGDAIPCLDIIDWPSLRYRGFQDDITRGPSPKLGTLKREIRLGAAFKMNAFSYYLEHQFAFAKHPVIGPEDGSLTPGELEQMVAFAKTVGIDIIGNQQSFAHFRHILKHKEYEHLREAGGVLCPTNEGSYRLLRDLYAEQAPLLPFPMFNVCCDETQALGTGPSKALVRQIGIGGVYVQHICRIHEILKNDFGKRMMMWGDIILKHPEHLAKIPKDTVMLTWGYGPRPSFEHQIVPFAESGYEFFVCPGVNCWSRILPDFAAATTNIANFVRDGAKHGALGMLNTTWDDDGENFFAPNWHGVLWSAECAWNASTTPVDAFNRRLGALLFGEPGELFGQAVELLAATHSLPGFDRMHDRRFWRVDTPVCRVSEATTREQARQLHDVVTGALQRLTELQGQARVNVDLIDYFLFGARRMELIGRRMTAVLDAAREYPQAALTHGDASVAARRLENVLATIRGLRLDHLKLRQKYEQLWNNENKPYGLARVLQRYDGTLATYNRLEERLVEASKTAGAGHPLPAPGEIGLQIAELGVRRAAATRVSPAPLQSVAEWAVSTLSHRVGIELDARGLPRADVPIELVLPPAVTGRADACELVELDATSNSQRHVVCQLDHTGTDGAEAILSFVACGPLRPGRPRRFMFYFGPTSGHVPERLPAAVSMTVDGSGAVSIRNSAIRLLLGAEGGHIYRWEVADLDGVDLTQPGESGWAGFADLGGARRGEVNELLVVADGPAMARVVCRSQDGFEKTITLFAGLAWVEITLNSGVTWFWNYDRVANFAADGPNPGSYSFSDKATGRVGAQADGLRAQVKRAGITWSAKHRADGLTLALLTPELKARHVVAPGAGAGGVGIEHSSPVTHFVTYGGLVERDVRTRLEVLRNTVSLRTRVGVSVFAVEDREKTGQAK